MKTIFDILLLAALTLLFYWRIAFTGQILPSYDLFVYFYPYRAFVNASLLQGEIPLWNPYIFMGVPGLANIQSAVFYPLNLLTLGLEPPQAVNVAILVHVFLAGAFMYAFCRVSAGLDRPSALISGIVFMFSGFLSAQAAHINQLSASAWLPLLLLLFDRAYQLRSLRLGVLGSLVFAVQVLAGHPQEAFLSVAALGVFAVFRFHREVGARCTVPLHKSTVHRALGIARCAPTVPWPAALRMAIILAIMLLLGLGLAAFQVVPTFELSSLSIRSGGMRYQEAMSFSLPPLDLLRSLLPSFLENPYSEFIAYVGVLGLGLVALAFRRGRHPYVVFCVLLMIVSFFFAFGGFNPMSRLVYKLLPWLGIFRVPARWLFLYTFAAALAAGIGFGFLLTPARERLGSLSKWKPALARWAITCLGIGLLLAIFSPIIVLPQFQVRVIWAVLIAASAALFWLGPFVAGRRLASLVAIALTVELFFAGAELDLNRLVPSFAYSSLRPSETQLLTDAGAYRVLSVASSEYEAGDTKDMAQVLGYQPAPQQLEDLMSGLKYKEILAPNLPMVHGIATIDGYDGGLLPLKRYDEMRPALLTNGLKRDGKAIDPGSRDALLRIQLASIPDTRLLGALNVKYVIGDKRNDAWIDGTYYDFSTPVALGSDESVALIPPRFEATALGLVTYLSGDSAIPQDEPVAEVSLTDIHGRVTRAVLRAGVDTAEGRLSPQPAHQGATPRRVGVESGPGKYLAKIKFDAPLYAKAITVTARPGSGRLHVVGASLIDERTLASETLSVNSRLRLVHSGDVKIYENLDFRPRAYLVHRAQVAKTTEAALQALRAGIQSEVVLADLAGPLPGADTRPALSPGEGAEIISYKPGRVAIRSKLETPGFLVFSESYYPGWRARVDGAEVPILRANVLFQAVSLTPGEHVVEFEYVPASLIIGLAVSVASVALAVLAAWRTAGLRLP